MSEKRFWWFTWGLTVIAIVVPALAWLDARDWSIRGLSFFTIFPLLGMWAWLLMWTHYVTGAVRLHFGLHKFRHYSEVTGALVLSCLLLHPALLVMKQFQLGYGLPPKSTVAFVGEAKTVALYFGVISLVIFLSFEFFDRMKQNKIVLKNWRWISLSQILAMILVFVHALRLGQHLGNDWMRIFWLVAGIVLVPCMARLLYDDFTKKAIENEA